MTRSHLFSVEASSRARGRRERRGQKNKQRTEREVLGRGRLEAEGACERFQMDSGRLAPCCGGLSGGEHAVW